MVLKEDIRDHTVMPVKCISVDRQEASDGMKPMVRDFCRLMRPV